MGPVEPDVEGKLKKVAQGTGGELYGVLTDDGRVAIMSDIGPVAVCSGPMAEMDAQKIVTAVNHARQWLWEIQYLRKWIQNGEKRWSKIDRIKVEWHQAISGLFDGTYEYAINPSGAMVTAKDGLLYEEGFEYVMGDSDRSEWRVPTATLEAEELPADWDPPSKNHYRYLILEMLMQILIKIHAGKEWGLGEEEMTALTDVCKEYSDKLGYPDLLTWLSEKAENGSV